MSSQFPNSPRLVKGALLEFGDAVLGLVPNIVFFQYNPEQLSHKLEKTRSQDAGQTETTERRENLRISNLPVETIDDLKLFLDATDKMEEAMCSPQLAGSVQRSQPWRRCCSPSALPRSTSATCWAPGGLARQSCSLWSSRWCCSSTDRGGWCRFKSRE